MISAANISADLHFKPNLSVRHPFVVRLELTQVAQVSKCFKISFVIIVMWVVNQPISFLFRPSPLAFLMFLTNSTINACIYCTFYNLSWCLLKLLFKMYILLLCFSSFQIYSSHISLNPALCVFKQKQSLMEKFPIKLMKFN